jgi:hypothetical protein
MTGCGRRGTEKFPSALALGRSGALRCPLKINSSVYILLTARRMGAIVAKSIAKADYIVYKGS